MEESTSTLSVNNNFECLQVNKQSNSHISSADFLNNNSNSAIADSGCNSHYIPTSHIDTLINVKKDDNPIIVKCANNSTMVSSHTGELNIPHLPSASKQVRIFEELSYPLLSIGQLCNDNMEAIFDKNSVRIIDSSTKNVILTGSRHHTGIYNLPLTTVNNDSNAAFASIYSHLATKISIKERIKFISSAFGNPADSTLIAAANEGHLKSIPNITASQIRHHLPNSIETAKGHMDLSRQNIWSSKIKNTDTSTKPVHQYVLDNENTHTIFTSLVKLDELHCDFAGAFPHRSRTGNTHVLIAYSAKGRMIKSAGVNGLTSAAMITAYHEIIQYFRHHGIYHEIVKLDSQTSLDLENYFNDTVKINHKYVAPGNHRTLHAERDIRTWKNHYISTLAGVDPSFPKNLWDLLLPFIDMTLAILRTSGIIANTSSWDFVNRENPFDFQKTPFGPAGCKVLVYENASSRASMADHGIEGYFIGPALDYYRCFSVYIPSTKSIRVCDTVSWHTHDPTHLLSDLSTNETIQLAISSFNEKIIVTSNPIEKDHLSQCIKALNHLLVNTANTLPPPANLPATPLPIPTAHRYKLRSAVPLQRVPVPTTDPVPPVPVTAQVQRVSARNGEPVPVTVPSLVPSLTQSQSNPILQPTTETVKTKKVSFQNVPTTTYDNDTKNTKIKSSTSVAKNTHHTTTDKNPKIQNAIKILSHKGSNSNPLKPLRFRVRWENLSHHHDTYEPWDNIKMSKPAIDYVNDNPTLWHLLISDNRKIEIANAVLAQNYSLLLSNDAPIDTTNNDSIPSLLIDDDYDYEYFAYAAGDIDTNGETLKYKKLIKGPNKNIWLAAGSKEFRKLFTERNTMHPTLYDNIPLHKRKNISYYNPQCKTKQKSWGLDCRVRGTYGGNNQNYHGITASYQAAMVTTKLLLNKTISDIQSKVFTMDITDMYLQSQLPPDQYEYMVIDINEVPDDIISEYNLTSFLTPNTNKFYVEVTGALYGMKQAGYIANKDLVNYLESNDYMQAKNTPCLFKHTTDDIEFSLITDDFLVRYGNKQSADKLLKIMSEKYPMTHDWSCVKYAGLNIKLNYDKNRSVTISMDGYIEAILKRFKIVTTHNVYSPEFYTQINYASKESQLTKVIDESPICTDAEKTLIQQIAGSILYYAIGIDATMRPAIDHITMEQANPTHNTLAKCTRLLHYAATFPNASITYYPSDMILMSNADASYNSESNARSRGAVITWCGKSNNTDFTNGPIECISTLLPTIVASAAEAEYATLFIAGKSLLPLRHTLLDMNIKQPPTTVITDNEAAKNIANSTCKQRRSKSIDMRYHWIRDRIKLKDFNVIWKPGISSIADYMTKTQPVANVLKMRKFYVNETSPTFPPSNSRIQNFQQST